MDKKLRLSIIYVVLLSLLIGGAIMLSKPTEKSKYNIKTTVNKNSNAVVTEDDQESVNAYKNEISKSEIINVFNNVSDIDLHANLIEDKSGQVSLNLVYKLNGKLVEKKLDTSNLSEIRNIFRFREQQGKGYQLNNMILNDKMNKLYFCVEGKKNKNYAYTSIYSYSLDDLKIERLIYDLGKFNKFYISPDKKYNAFSYEVCPQNVSSNEKSIVVVIRCSDNKIVLNSNKDKIGIQDGINNNFYVYSYDFIKWKNNNTCELRQSINSKDESQQETKQTILVNIDNRLCKET